MATWREALNTIAQNIPAMVNTILEYENLELRREQIVLGQDQLTLETDRLAVDEIFYKSRGAYYDSATEQTNADIETSAKYGDLVDDYNAQLQTIRDTENPDLLDSQMKTLRMLQDQLEATLKIPGKRTYDENEQNAREALYTLQFMQLLNVTVEDRQKIAEKWRVRDFNEASAIAISSPEYSAQFRGNLEKIKPLMETILEAVTKSALAQEPFISREQYLENTINGLNGKDAVQNWFESDEEFQARTGVAYEKARVKHDEGNYGNVFLVMDTILKLYPSLGGAPAEQVQGIEVPETRFRPSPYTTTPDDYARSRLGVVDNPYLPAPDPRGMLEGILRPGAISRGAKAGVAGITAVGRGLRVGGKKGAAGGGKSLLKIPGQVVSPLIKAGKYLRRE